MCCHGQTEGRALALLQKVRPIGKGREATVLSRVASHPVEPLLGLAGSTASTGTPQAEQVAGATGFKCITRQRYTPG
jgi:hypothetical protein